MLSTQDQVIGMAAVESMLQCIDPAPDRAGLRDTPRRVVKSWEELFGGYHVDEARLYTTFEQPCRQIILLRNVEFYSHCEHHLLPFIGVAHIAYLPAGGKVVGVSKLARVLDMYARRLQIQERICQQVVDSLMTHLQPEGAYCAIEARHLCMACRGVNKQQSEMVTASLSGCFEDDPSCRAELLKLIWR